MANFYITTTLPYVNAEPHIGFAMEIIQADVLARYHRLIGDDVIFNTGTDEHGQKIYQKATEISMNPQAYCDTYAATFEALKKALHLSYINFTRTTDTHHIEAAQAFWKRCLQNDDIYKKIYKIKYCIGCELEKTDSDLLEGKCSLHPNQNLEIYEEENYFFKFSKYQKPLLDFYEKNQNFVVPKTKFNEIIVFVQRGLEDFSISRLKSKMPWGIAVPDDSEHVMYVWFDALINYISTLGWPENKENFNNFWPVIQFAGKDQVRQQAAMWQAMLMSAGLANSKQIFIHGFLTIDGQKISKSLGNVINPIKVVETYGTDATRYYLLAKVHPWEDSDFSLNKFKETYNADLANGLGNLIARVAKLCERSEFEFAPTEITMSEHPVFEYVKKYNFAEAVKLIWQGETESIRWLDQKINEQKPWKLEDATLKNALTIYVQTIRKIATVLQPFLPETAEKIQKQFNGSKIVSGQSLFPRIV